MLMALLLVQTTSGAAPISDIQSTKHNFSTSGSGTVKATSETQVCAFCHTPHAATTKTNDNVAVVAPLWNRSIPSTTSYTTYSSSSLDAQTIQGALSAPGGSSKLCLSCHDGTLAIGSVNVLNGTAPATIAMAGTNIGKMPDGSYGATTGFTRNLGVDLTNDHPISVTYNKRLADADGELRVPSNDTKQEILTGLTPIVGRRDIGYKPLLPLESTGPSNEGQIQCATCHDPHIKGDGSAGVNGSDIKFLRTNRFQGSPATGGAFDQTKDIICLACHDKAGMSWAYSTHANSQVAQQTYATAATTVRSFPANIPVWQAACLNCHDTHTVQGSRRLLREGTDSITNPKTGGNPAIEETCYQCHSNTSIVSAIPKAAPDIKTDFTTVGNKHMPITSADQPGVNKEKHDIGNDPFNCTEGAKCGKDFIESRQLLGYGAGNDVNRHVECTDCHNPHRVVKFASFAGASGSGNITGAPDSQSTHKHAAGHTNVASGVLRGSWGVEPNYISAPFGSLPNSYTVRRGDPGTNNLVAADIANNLTREYQVCLKCHSDYGYGNTPPALGSFVGGTAAGTNGTLNYTNQAMEFQAPVGHRGEIAAGTTDSGAFKGLPAGQAYAVDFQVANHRGWHPVLGPTGRTLAIRTASTSSWNAPFNLAADVGVQTMYCTDCHGSNTTTSTIGTPVVGVPSAPDTGKPWGPHGSSNNFILKGDWSQFTGRNTPNDLCFKCHNYNNYTSAGGLGQSGFSMGGTNLHSVHVDKIGNLRCSLCHVALPHGWKNKALLVNLNDVGPEVMCRQQDADDQPIGKKCTVGLPMPTGTQMRNGAVKSWFNIGYSNPPYYNNAVLKIKTFATSGNWTAANCGSAGAPGNGQTGGGWMESSEGCKNIP